MAKFRKTKYHVEYDEKILCKINRDMILKYDVGEKSLLRIKELHVAKHINRMLVETAIRQEWVSNRFLKISADIEKEIEFLLQEAWGFDRDEKYHKFWEFPNCQCPDMDNRDRYPSEYYVISGECPIHS